MVNGRARLYLASLLISLSACGALAAYLFASNIQSGDISAWLTAHRYAWYAPPLVALAFVVFSLVPVMLLVSLTGVAFGPLLGPLYAMAGCLASASTVVCDRTMDWTAECAGLGRRTRRARDAGAAPQRNARGVSHTQDSRAVHARQRAARSIRRRLPRVLRSARCSAWRRWSSRLPASAITWPRRGGIRPRSASFVHSCSWPFR